MRRRAFTRFCLSFILLLWVTLPMAGQSLAEDVRPIARGTQGLVAVPFTARNTGPGAIACGVALAHWYSVDLGEAAPGGTISAALWADPKTGDVVLLNAMQDQMPVLSLWCGIAGHSWNSRADIGFDHRSGEVPAPIHIACAPRGESLACR